MGIVVEPVGAALLFDCYAPCSRSMAAAMHGAGFQGCVRDIDDLTAPELKDLLAEGLGVMVYQSAHGAGWVPSETLGNADGLRVVTKARAIGYAEGATIYNDIEGPITTATSHEIAAWANAKCDVVQKAYWKDGEYIGYGTPLTPAELFHLFKATSYWHSGSNVADVETRGYAMRQVIMDIMYLGQRIDVNLAQPDKLRGCPYWMRSS